MPTFRRIRRTIATLLLVLYLPACSQHVPPQYLTPGGITPQEYIATKHPTQVRLTLADSSSRILDQPWASHDSIGGLIAADTWNPGTPWAAPVGSVRCLEVPGPNSGGTAALDAFAQASPLQPGDRVRVTAPTEGLVKQEGRFEKLQGDSAIVVNVEGQWRVLPIPTVTRLEYVYGRRHHASRGMAVGAAVGAVAGALAGYASGEEQCGGRPSCGWLSFCLCLTREEAAGVGVAGGAIAGGLIGLVAGAFITTDRWEEVPLGRLSLAWGDRTVVQPRVDSAAPPPVLR